MSRERNRKGEGSIYQRKDGYWISQIYVGKKSNGKHDYKRKSFKDYDEAVAWKATVLADQQLQPNITVPEPPKELSFSDWLDLWLRDHVKPNVRPRTWENHSYIVNNHLKPTLGHCSLTALEASQLQTLLNDKLQSGLSNRMVELILITARSALRKAVEEGHVTVNIADTVHKPRKEDDNDNTDMAYMSPTEMATFLAIAKEDRLCIAFQLLLGTGLRVGELLALRWVDVDLDKKIINLRLSAVRIRNDDETVVNGNNYKVILQEANRKDRQRQIPLNSHLIKALQRWKVYQDYDRQLTGDQYVDTGFVVTTSKGTAVLQRNLTRKFHQLLVKANLPLYSLFSLRKTFAVQLLEMDVRPEVIQELMGIDSLDYFMEKYGGVSQKSKANAVEKIGVG
ncbi:tyrosine-type recombinase/integrase [Heliorestis convoluta]|uniref:Site-specific integrase n=1 Tax=Heliorestis convoluta TaxID=356322 RepID=A0A5Q2MY49_9FIRM|nr:site-specific integrase [Heliorestis convoluta]QGG47628.1 site-specific integrase [Heliorestis convoluta]